MKHHFFSPGTCIPNPHCSLYGQKVLGNWSYNFGGTSRNANPCPCFQMHFSCGTPSVLTSLVMYIAGGNSQPARDLELCHVQSFPQSLDLDVISLSVSWLMIISFHLALMKLAGLCVATEAAFWMWYWGWNTCMIRVSFLCQGREPGTEEEYPMGAN